MVVSACQCRRQRRCGFGLWVGKISWRRKWQPTPVFLPGELDGKQSLVGYSPRGCKGLGTAEHMSRHTPIAQDWVLSSRMAAQIFSNTEDVTTVSSLQ